MINYLMILLPWLPVNLLLTVVTVLISLLLALLFTVIITLRTPVLTSIVMVYITLFTGTPLLIQIFLIYYGPGQFTSLRTIHWLWQLLSQPWLCAILALALNSTAYSTQLFAGAMRTIPSGQWQSCAALGMSHVQSLQLLIPFAIKRALSSYSNEIVLVFKSTSLVYTITIMDIMGQSQILYGRTYDMMVFGATGIIYLCINSMITFVMRMIERWALRFEYGYNES